MEIFCEHGQIEPRSLGSLAKVLRSSEKLDPEEIVYNVCRGENKKDALRYDLTKIGSGDLNGEFPKTFGHYHGKGFAELFEVLEGKTILLLQKFENDPALITEFYAIEINKGKRFIVPSGYGFCNINASPEELLLSNWVYENVENLYENVEKFKGLCQYFINKDGRAVFEKNLNYSSSPDVVWLKEPIIPEELEDLKFLTEPKKYQELLTIYNLYKK